MHDPLFHYEEERDLRFVPQDRPRYTAADVIADLFGMVVIAAIMFGMWCAL